MPLMGSGVVAVEYALGSQTLTYEELEQRFGVDVMKKVYSGSGIRNRRVAAPDVCGSDLAFEAANRLFSNHPVDRASIDLLIHCTQSPDYFLPTTACILQDRLGLKKECAAFDINLGCSQYVYALSVAHSMIAAGLATRALVLTGDTMSHTIHPRDRSLAPLLGDAGSATLVDQAGEGQGFLAFEFGTDGSGHRYLMVPAGGFRNRSCEETRREETDKEGSTRTQENMFMNGAAIFHFAISVVPKTVDRILVKSGLKIEEVDLVLFHQANRYMLDYLVKKLRIPAEKTHFFVEDIGNTSGSTMPLLLADAIGAGKVRPGAVILMVVFGVGLSWAAVAIRWLDQPLREALPAS
jgi:3-oxoacyl-[acyl-carrier-protein] synthase-3